MKLIIGVATMQNGNGLPGDIPTWTAYAQTINDDNVFIVRNTVESNRGVIGSYQHIYENTDAAIIAYTHDDVICREQGWDRRVLDEFEDPKVGVVGFGGGLRHGAHDLYKTPYRLQQLARSGYLSNVDDAETHGERFTGSRNVAVLDGFALIVRRSLLDRCGGWPVDQLFFHSYDYWVCCMAHELGYSIRIVGIRCHHSGGRTSTTKEYNEYTERKLGLTDAQIHEQSHRFIYERFRNVLPWRADT